MNLPTLSASDIAAWWGAVLATLVFAWDIYKWRTAGPRLVLKAIQDMQSTGDPSSKLYVMVEVVNRGDRPATITHLAVYQYSSRLNQLRGKRKHQGIVPTPGWGPGLPFEIGPGQRWTGSFEQQAVFDMFKGGLLSVAVMHTGSNKEVIFHLRKRK